MIVGILGPGGCGATMLDWSIQYLSGQDKTWCIEVDPQTRSTIVDQSVMTVPDNPVTEQRTAHAYKKNHPNENSLGAMIDILKNRTEFALNSFYFTDSMASADNKPRTTFYNKIVQHYPEIKFITYQFTEQDIDIIFGFQLEKIARAQEEFRNLVVYDNRSMKDLPVWDQRELMSLYYPSSIRGQILSETVYSADNNFVFDYRKIFDLEKHIDEIFEYLALNINVDRYNIWQESYTAWKQKNSTLFYDNLPTIVDCILNNQSHDLTQYQMTLAKEIILSSKLIHNHGLSLKSYGIENLSNNTTQWYKILEPNIYHNF